ncbi:MAG: hypothetical protein RSA10_01585 [Bacilli bacterium]
MKKVLMILGGIVLGLVVLVIAIFTIVSFTSKKLVCESSQGNITIMYNDKTITGYKASGMSYDMDQQKTVAAELGIKKYISDFSVWFSTNTTGTCKK